MSSSYDDETTLLVVTAAPKIKEEDTTRSNTILPSTAFKCLAAILGMMACAAFVGGSVGSDHNSTVALSAWGIKTLAPRPETQECLPECQYIGEQETDWHDASGRLCCLKHGIDHDKCHLNSHRNYCNCVDVADDNDYTNPLRKPCYIDTRCDPFQTWQDETCKAKPGTQCSDSVGCTRGYKCFHRIVVDGREVESICLGD